MDRHLPGGHDRLAASARQVIQPLSVLLERAVHGRRLQNRPHEARKDGPDGGLIRPTVPAGHGHALRILRIGGHAEGDLGHIFLLLVLQIVKQAGGLAHHDRQDARRLRVQRTRMPCLCAIQQAAHIAHHLRRGHSRRLEHVEKAAQRPCLRHAFTLPNASASAASTACAASARGRSTVRPLASRCPPPPNRAAT